MKIQSLEDALQGAPNWAKIVLELYRTIPGIKAAQQSEVTAWLIYYAENAKIMIEKADEAASKLTFAKTPFLTQDDIEKLSRLLSDFVVKVEVRAVPNHELVLEEIDGNWQLRLTGGNKLLKMFFKSCTGTAKKHCGFEATVIYDKEGTVILDLSSGTQTSIFNFAEAVADTLAIPLQLA